MTFIYAYQQGIQSFENNSNNHTIFIIFHKKLNILLNYLFGFEAMIKIVALKSKRKFYFSNLRNNYDFIFVVIFFMNYIFQHEVNYLIF